jgi:hypothetical protein
MPGRRPPAATLPPLERRFEETRHSLCYLIMAFERASPTVLRRTGQIGKMQTLEDAKVPGKTAPATARW